MWHDIQGFMWILLVYKCFSGPIAGSRWGPERCCGSNHVIVADQFHSIPLCKVIVQYFEHKSNNSWICKHMFWLVVWLPWTHIFQRGGPTTNQFLWDFREINIYRSHQILHGSTDPGGTWPPEKSRRAPPPACRRTRNEIIECQRLPGRLKAQSPFMEVSWKWGYPNSWLVYSGKSHPEMDDDLGEALF